MPDPFHWLGRCQAGLLDRYFLACAREQRLADARLVRLMRGEPDGDARELRQARELATRLAAAVSAGGAVAQEAPALDVEVPDGVPVELAEKLLRPALPECLGYDLSDVEVCGEDAAWWQVEVGGAAAWLVGIRTGGSYFVPFWAAAAGDGYATVRPLAGGKHVAAELEPLRRIRPRPAHVVLLDDQPDSGATLETVAQQISLLAPQAHLWSSSPGRVQRRRGGGPRRERSPLIPRRRLWELLGDPEAAVERVAQALGCEPARLELRFAVTELRRRYDPGRRWLPWNHEALHGKRRLVNPRKTPFVLYERQTGRPLFHARFIGEAIFGRAELERVRAFGQLPPNHFVDGYLVTEHAPGLDEGRDVEPLLEGAAAYFRALVATSRLAGTVETRLRPRETLLARLDALSSRLGRSLTLPGEIAVAGELELAGPSQVLVSSSLPYSHPAWHWRAEPNGRVRRFHLDALWGGVGSLEREIASFALELRLEPAQLGRLLARLPQPPPPAAVCLRLPEALLLWLDSWLRNLRRPGAEVAQRISDELAEHWRWLARLQRTMKDGDPRHG